MLYTASAFATDLSVGSDDDLNATIFVASAGIAVWVYIFVDTPEVVTEILSMG